MGYFSFNGNLDCCITIRTALIKDGKAYVQAGGGWVTDSTPEGEFQETVNKAKSGCTVALFKLYTRLASPSTNMAMSAHRAIDAEAGGEDCVAGVVASVFMVCHS